MKRTSPLSLLMMVFMSFTFITKAQKSSCRLNAGFKVKTNVCSVDLTDASKASNGTAITAWHWSFGDGDTSIVQNPTHAYKYSGRYKISLTITGVNDSGKVCKDRSDREIDVRGCAADSLRCHLSAKFKYVKDSSTCMINFTDESTSTSATTILSRRWSFGDGDTSIAANPTHDYKYSGRYNVCLTIVGINAAGEKCMDRECRTITFKGCPDDSLRCRLSAKFKYIKDSSSCNVNFYDSSKVSSATTIVSRRWSFGDGDTSLVANPTHSYKYSGRYEVCLTIVGMNAAGEKCVDRECHDIVLRGCASDSLRCRLRAAFGYSADSTSVKFSDSSKIASSTTVTKWFWSFGDGAVDSVQNPTHVYSKKGSYYACLTIMGVNEAGETCRDRECKKINIRNKRDGIENENTNVSLQVYPNPAKDVVNIHFEIAKEGQANISVSDIQGRKLFVVKEGYFSKGAHNLSWNVSVPTGWYFITVVTDGAVENKQVFIQK